MKKRKVIMLMLLFIATIVVIYKALQQPRKKPTIGVECKEGLGNLLFRFAFIYSLARDNDCNFTLDGLDGYFNVHSNQDYAHLKRDITGLPNYRPTMNVEHKVREWNEFKHDDYNVYCDRNTLFSGYFQSEKYFSKYREDLLNILKEPDIVTRVLDDADIRFDTGMFLHVRTGDYGPLNVILPKSYYETCLAQVPDGVENIYVFSNNIDDAKKMLGNYNVHFVEHLDELETMYCMARMKYGGICANSSFSWWGAWLNTSKCKTIFMPKNWWRGTHCPDIHFDNALVV